MPRPLSLTNLLFTNSRSLPRKKTLVTPLYLTYQDFETIPKTGDYRAFFVIRDPRDLVVSQYFSKLYSHKRSGEIDQVRQELGAINQEDGLARMIDHLAENGYWDRVRTWGKQPILP